MRILLSGGGTMGPVSPLLAIIDSLRHSRPGRDEFLWIGTQTGPERVVIENYGIPFIAIPGGKLRRYLSAQNFFDIFRVLRGYHKAKKIVRDFKPDILLTAGGYICAPVAKAAYKYGVPYFVHQQDVVPGIANKLMVKHATLITLALSGSLSHFPKDKTLVVGNPVRAEIGRGDRERARQIFQFKDKVPVVFITGGGIGAAQLNVFVWEALVDLTKRYQIIHITGNGKFDNTSIPVLPPFQADRYRHYEFLTSEMKDAYALADLVVCRGGMGTATELSLLGKPALIIPIPDSHQVANALYFKKNNAAFVLDQKNLNGKKFAASIDLLFSRPGDLAAVGRNIHAIMKRGAEEEIIGQMLKVVKS